MHPLFAFHRWKWKPNDSRRVSRVRFRGMLLPRFRQSGTAGNVVSSCTKFATAISRSIFEDYPVSAVALPFRSRDLAQWSAAFSRFPFRTEDLKFRRRGLTEIVSSNFVHDITSIVVRKNWNVRWSLWRRW